MPEGLTLELVDNSPAPAPAPTPVADPAPSEVPAPKTEEVKVDPAPPTDPEKKVDEVLYELPDGRKVDGPTLSKEWKENFYPEFTRKSQKLAEYEKSPPKQDINKPPEDEVPAWKKPGYEPESYAEVIEIAKTEFEKDQQTKIQKQEAQQKALEDRVNAEMAEVKKLEPTIDENLIYAHATKYGFPSLVAAYKNFADIRQAKLDAEQTTLKNIESRKAIPVADGKNTPPVETGQGADINNIRQFSSANDFYNSTKGK